MRRSRQMSESIELGIVLALAGGFMDAYSYMCRDEVFANAQTGNMLLLGINLSERNWGMALRYLFPVLAFAVGIALADVVRVHAKIRACFIGGSFLYYVKHWYYLWYAFFHRA